MPTDPPQRPAAPAPQAAPGEAFARPKPLALNRPRPPEPTPSAPAAVDPLPRANIPLTPRLAPTARPAMYEEGLAGPVVTVTLAGGQASSARPSPSAGLMSLPTMSRFQPREPRTWEETGTDPLLVEQIVLRYLLVVGSESGRNIATDICMSTPLVKELLDYLKQQKLVQHRTSTNVGDFVYDLTDLGRARAHDYKRICSYVGPAPVPFEQYLQSVKEQSPSHRDLTQADLDHAFEDLLVSRKLLARIGPAITSGRALFLHGSPGNGKTSIAERLTRCFGDTIWIPQTLLIDGHLVKVYDPATHRQVESDFKPLTAAERLDRRWIKIERPTVVAGGELTLEMLEIQLDPLTNICEAPLQLKANCGTLVIDDFGRQLTPPQILLNRWIFPLEKRLDFLKLPDGRKITAPFDPILVFSTNLEPRQLVDEAFLRRIPYKVEVLDPEPDEFCQLVEMMAPVLGVALPAGAAEDLVFRHYHQANRSMRFCQPRDLLQQIANQARFERSPAVATPEAWDMAVSNYFGTL